MILREPLAGKYKAMQPKSIDSHLRLSEKAYEAIKEYILTADLRHQPPGSRLDEKALVASLNVSRTPVREAMNRLAAEGFLEVVPYKGVFIATKDKKEILSILMVRATLEGMAARLSTSRFENADFATMREMFTPFINAPLDKQRYEFSIANIKFHEFIFEHTDNTPLINMAKTLFDHMRLIRFRTSAFLPRLRSALVQHLELVDIFERRDPETAERHMRSHIEESAQYIDEWDKMHRDSKLLGIVSGE
jgi:DNA-binding GntR family transcriptional regulator